MATTNTNYLQALTLVVNQQISITATRGVSPSSRIAGNIVAAQVQVPVYNATHGEININRISDTRSITNVQINQDLSYAPSYGGKQLTVPSTLATINVASSPDAVVTSSNYTTFDNRSIALTYGGLTFTVTNYTSQLYQIQGTYSWTAPAGVTSINVAAVGAGGGGVHKITGGAGGGGGLSNYENNLRVVPGQTYTIVVGTGGTVGSSVGVTGGDTYMYPASTNVPMITAGGGAGGSNMFWVYPDRTITGEDTSGVFSQQSAVDPGNNPITYSVSSGSLPSNMSLNATTGDLTWTESSLATTGTVNTSTTYGPITLQATNSIITINKPIYLVVNSNPVDPYFTATQIALTMGSTATTFLKDNSSYNNQGIAGGLVTPSTMNPFDGSYYSALFDGSTGFLTVSTATNLDVGANSFTVEFWWQPKTTIRQTLFSSNSDFWLSLEYNTIGAGRLGLYASTNGTSWDIISAGSGGNGVTSGTPNLGQWNHIALSKLSSSWAVWLNGVRVLSLSLAGSIVSRVNEVKIIGASTSAASNKVNGWMSNFKFVIGGVTYNPSSTTITIPTSPLTVDSANVRLLALQDPWFRNNASLTAPITLNGTVSVVPFHPFSVANANSTTVVHNSTYFSAATDYVFYKNQLIGPTNFTIDAWIYPLSKATTSTIITNTTDFLQGTGVSVFAGNALAGAGMNRWSALIGASSATSTTVPNLVGTSTIRLNQWSHVAISRIGNTSTLYVNGVLDATTSSTTTQAITGLGPYTVIGNTWEGSSANFFNGYISNLRIVNGIGVYTGNFTLDYYLSTSTQIAATNIEAISSSTSTTLLTFQNIGPVNSSVLLDNSDYKNVITRVGSPALGSFNPYRQYTSSTYFIGNGSTYLSTSTLSPAYAFGTADFTMECWVLPTTMSAQGFGTIVEFRSGNTASAMNMRIDQNRYLRVYNGPASDDNPFTDLRVTMGVWSHIAAVRIGGVVYGYINGQLAGSKTFTADVGSVSQPMFVGFNHGGAAYHWNGYLSNLRVIKSWGIYTGPFTPPISPLTVTQSARTNVRPMNTGTFTTVLILQNEYTDASANNVWLTSNGAPSSEWQSPYPLKSRYSNYTCDEGGSVYFNGSSADYFSVANAPNIVLSASTSSASTTSTWTIECWVRPNGDYSTLRTAWSKRSAAGTAYEGGLAITTGYMYYYNGVTVYPTNVAAQAGVWTHLAWVFNATTGWLKMYMNGVLRATVTALTFQDYDTPVSVGALYNSTQLFNGWISDLRIVKGIAVYEIASSATNTVAFTPPTSRLTTTQSAGTNIAAITDSRSTVLLLNFDNAPVYDLTAKNNLVHVGLAQKSDVNYKYGAGSMFFPYTADRGARLPVDSIRTPLASNIAGGSNILGADFTVEYWFNSKGFKTGDRTTNLVFTSRYQVHYDCRVALGGATGFTIGTTEYGQLIFYTNGLFAIVGYVTVLPNTWNHVALVRYNGHITLYLNGQSQGKVINTSVFNDNQSVIGLSHSDTINPMDGYIDELRITKLARYTDSFVPPYRIKGK